MELDDWEPSAEELDSLERDALKQIAERNSSSYAATTSVQQTPTSPRRPERSPASLVRPGSNSLSLALFLILFLHIAPVTRASYALYFLIFIDHLLVLTYDDLYGVLDSFSSIIFLQKNAQSPPTRILPSFGANKATGEVLASFRFCLLDM